MIQALETKHNNDDIRTKDNGAEKHIKTIRNDGEIHMSRNGHRTAEDC